MIALPSLENGRFFFPLLARGPSWRLIHDEQFTARRKFKKRELEKAAKDFEPFVVSNVGQFARANKWFWQHEGDSKSMGGESFQLDMFEHPDMTNPDYPVESPDGGPLEGDPSVLSVPRVGSLPTCKEREGGGGGQNQPVEFHYFLLENPGIVIKPLKWNCKVTFLNNPWALLRKYLRLAPASMMTAAQFLEGCHPYTCAA